MLKAVVLRLRSLFEDRNQADLEIAWRKILILALIFLHILPLWIFKYFPSQDGAAHVYNSYVLKALNDEESTFLREYYKLNLTLFPNWCSHIFMALLMHVFPPLVSEKILLSLIVALFPLSLFYFLDAVNKGQNLFGFLGFLFSHHYLMLMGFYNFALSVPLYFFALGYFMKHREEMHLSKMGILNLLCILTYFCHIISYGLLILSLTLLSITSFYRKPRRIFGLLTAMLPLYFIMVNYLLSSDVGQASISIDMRWVRFVSAEAWSYLLNNQALVYFTNAHQIVTRLMLVMLGVVFAITLIHRIRQRQIVTEGNQFLLLSGILTFIYFIMPWSVGSGAWVNDRVSLFIFPVMLAFLKEDYHKHIRNGLIIIIVILSIARLSISCRYYYPLDKSMKEFTSGMEFIEKDKIVLGLSSDRSPGVKDVLPSTHEEYVEPFTHVVDYYCLNNGCVSLSNYEAQFPYFPLNWTEKIPEVIHYIVAWKLDETDPEASGNDIKGTHGLDVREITDSLRTDYDLIHSTENLKLYRHRAVQSDGAE